MLIARGDGRSIYTYWEAFEGLRSKGSKYIWNHGRSLGALIVLSDKDEIQHNIDVP
jgi:hypothetical protein